MTRILAAIAVAAVAAAALAAAGQQASPPGAARAGIQAAPEDPTWNRRASGGGDYATVMEVSGREEVFRFMERPENPEDLRCFPGDTRPKDFMTIPKFAAQEGKKLRDAVPMTGAGWKAGSGHG